MSVCAKIPAKEMEIIKLDLVDAAERIRKSARAKNIALTSMQVKEAIDEILSVTIS